MAKDKLSKQLDKGVHVPSDSISSSYSTSKDEDRSMTRIKKDVKAVIELMGPNTPHFEQIANLSEESIFPNTTNSKKEIKVEDEDLNYQTDQDVSTLPPDVTINEPDLSLLVENPTTVTPPAYMCPPPNYPTSYVYNSECMCPQMANLIQAKYQGANRPSTEKSKFFSSMCKLFKDKKNTWPNRGDYYTINVKQSTKTCGAPRRLVFDLVEDLPNPTNECENNCYPKDNLDRYFQNESKNFKSPSKHLKQEDQVWPVDGAIKALCKNQRLTQKTTYMDENGTTRVDVYYFDHGCSNYFRTTDRSPILSTEALAERTEIYTTKFWAELFGTFNIGFSFFTSFVLQLIRFVLYTIIRPMTVGVLQLLSDYLFKPLLCAIFNALIQPLLIFLYNIASSIRDFCDPVAEALGYFVRELSAPIRAFRFVEVRKEFRENNSAQQTNKKNNSVI